MPSWLATVESLVVLRPAQMSKILHNLCACGLSGIVCVYCRFKLVALSYANSLCCGSNETFVEFFYLFDVNKCTGGSDLDKGLLL